jgi:serine/threonine-protein kinase SRPK3
LARNEQYVALKILVAEISENNRELKVLRALKELGAETGSHHVMQLFDQFHVEGPNGKHECLVLEFLGPSISDVLDSHFNDTQLPGHLAKTIALVGIAFLHEHGIAHGGAIDIKLTIEISL